MSGTKQNTHTNLTDYEAIRTRFFTALYNYSLYDPRLRVVLLYSPYDHVGHARLPHSTYELISDRPFIILYHTCRLRAGTPIPVPRHPIHVLISPSVARTIARSFLRSSLHRITRALGYRLIHVKRLKVYDGCKAVTKLRTYGAPFARAHDTPFERFPSELHQRFELEAEHETKCYSHISLART